jgi:hypothetical protein
MFGVLLSVMVGFFISGKVFFNAFANAVRHSWRN